MTDPLASRVRAEHAALLRSRGLRVTPQRIVILGAIAGAHDHFSAEDIHSAIAEDNPGINLSTVYRTLETFERHHLVRRTDLGLGRIVYHWSGRLSHHHLVCHACGRIVEIEDDALDPLKRELERRYAFHADLNHQSIFGHCADCLNHDDAEEGLPSEKP
ncbi:MAG: Fur family transcriptional regulator [Chloroflexota bacterium]|nr:transcriptional repressor [Dehalococcoidia bacterium]MDW8252748.1 Fur family transcriptional regulator [Chloroflexota bacterium]